MSWIYHNDIAAHDRIASVRKHTRAYIARMPSDLYDASCQHLAVYAKPYAPGWFLDTNLSYPGV